MAELYSLRKKTADPGSGALPQVAPAAPGWGQTHPLWRSILSPSNDQRVLILDRVPDGVFKSLLGEGVRLQGPQPPTGGERGPYDLVLEGVRARWFGTQSGGSRSSMVVPGGKWVSAVVGSPLVGLPGGAVGGRAEIGLHGGPRAVGSMAVVAVRPDLPANPPRADGDQAYDPGRRPPVVARFRCLAFRL